MNGAAARWAHKGDKVIVISYCLVSDEEARRHRPKVVLVDDRNRPVKK
jgi:aspartate 1-decarboxylase